MKNLQWKGKLLGAVTLLLLCLGSFLVELYGFHAGVMALSAEQRVLREVPFSQLRLEDLELTEDGIFQITGPSPGFALEEPGFVSKLRVGTNGETEPMHLTLSGDDHVYDVHSQMKGESILRVNRESDQVFVEVSVDDGSEKFTLDSLWVDNRLTVNWLRVGLMCSVCFLAWFFVFCRKLAAGRLSVSFLVLAVTIGVNLALITPPWYGLDEGAHYIRAYQFANGNLGFDHEEELDWIVDMEDFFFYTGYTNSPHNTYDERQNFLDRYATTDYGMQAYFPTTAATYPFVPYFFAGLGILLGKLLGLPFVYTFYAGRVLNVLGYALICAFAIERAKLGKRLLFLMSLVPYALFSAGVYTADTLTVSFAVLAVALYLNMLSQEDGTLDWRLPGLFAVCCGAMAMCKLPYAPFCLLALTVPRRKFKTTKTAVGSLLLVFAVVGGISLATLLFGAGKGIIQWYQPGMSLVGQVKFILTHPVQYTGIMLNHVAENWQDYLFGSTWKMGFSRDVSGLLAAVTVLSIGAVTVVDYEPQAAVLGRWQKLACVGAAACSWALVLTALYVSFNVVGAPTIAGVQGRYFYPLLLLLLLLLKNTRIDLGLQEAALNRICYAGSAAFGIAAAVHLLEQFCM